MTEEWKPELKDEAPLDATKTTEERGSDLLTNTKEVRVRAGEQSYRVNKDGMFLGAEQFDNAPFRVNMAGQLWATSVNTLQQEVTVEVGESIQNAINGIATTGGIVKLKSGTYTLTDDIIIPSNVKLQGNGQTVTLLNFQTLNKGIKAQGSSAYSTGSVSISNGTSVLTGGTAWLTNLTTSHKIRLDNFWYDIYAVTGNQSAYLTTSYIGQDLTNVAYDAAIMVQNFSISDLSVIYPGGNGIYFNYVYYWFIDRVTVAYGGANGVDVNNSTSSHMAYLNTFDNVGNGIDLNQVDHLETITLWSMRNGGIGVNGLNVRDTNFTSILGRNNTDGAYFDTLQDSVIYATDLSNNSSQGLELTNSNDVFIVSSEFQNNTSDGIKMTSNCDRCVVSGASFKENGAWGINVASATDDGNILMGNVFSGNVSGEVNDLGTNTRNDTNISVPWSGGSLVVANSGSHSTTGTVYTKLGEIQTFRTGSITAYFQLGNSDNSTQTYGMIYKNGSPTGTERMTTTTIPKGYEELIGVTSGDLVQLYGYTAPPYDICWVYNFSLRTNAIIDNKVNI